MVGHTHPACSIILLRVFYNRLVDVSFVYWNSQLLAAFTPTLQKPEAFSLCVGKGEAVVDYCDPLTARRLSASGFPEG
jgi:hypothetical protein